MVMNWWITPQVGLVLCLGLFMFELVYYSDFCQYLPLHSSYCRQLPLVKWQQSANNTTWSVHIFLFLYKLSYFLYSLSNFDLLDTTSNIPRSLNPLSWNSLSLHHTIESMLPQNPRNPSICLDTWTPKGSPLGWTIVQLSLCLSPPGPSVTNLAVCHCVLNRLDRLCGDSTVKFQVSLLVLQRISSDWWGWLYSQ